MSYTKRTENCEKLTSALIGESRLRGPTIKAQKVSNIISVIKLRSCPIIDMGLALNRGLPPPATVHCSLSCKRQSLAFPVNKFNNAAKPFQQ